MPDGLVVASAEVELRQRRVDIAPFSVDEDVFLGVAEVAHVRDEDADRLGKKHLRLRGVGARAGAVDGFVIRFVNDQKVSKPQDVIDIAKKSKRSIFIEGVTANGRPGYFGFGKDE